METCQLQHVGEHFSSHSNSSCLSQNSSGLNLNKLSELCQNYSSNESVSHVSSSHVSMPRGTWSESSPRDIITNSQLTEGDKTVNRSSDSVGFSDKSSGIDVYPSQQQQKSFLKLERRSAGHIMSTSICSSLISSMESVDNSNISEGN